MSPSRLQSSAWKLKPLHLPYLPGMVELAGPTTLGRDPANDVVIEAEEFPQVSSHHARIEARGRGLAIEDLGSTNGTLVNGRRVRRRALSSGDTIQLGDRGPRFVVLKTSELAALMGGARPGVRLGATQVVPQGGAQPSQSPALELRVGRDVRQTLWIAASLFAVLAAASVWGFVYLKRSGEVERARLAGASAQIQDKLEGRLQEASHRLDRQAEFWGRQRARLEAERDELIAQITAVEQGERSSSEGIAQLRSQLAETQRHLEMFDPVSLQQARLQDVSRVRRSVVLIEKTVVYRDSASGELLYFSDDAEDGDPLNFERDGQPLTLDSSTGSGFCISPDGWIVTNAHVLEFTSTEFPIQLREGVDLRPERRLSVVFSDDSARRPATVERLADGGGVDLALVKIEPFEGMPWLDGLELERRAPEPGSEVYLFGFPLGHHALQAGDTVIASTFKGILSRVVDSYIQVDAGVYPGNSGGPLTDARGNVIGVIFSVQNNVDGTTAANIGYAIPISAVASIWPAPQGASQ